jgi:hypothetical protein
LFSFLLSVYHVKARKKLCFVSIFFFKIIDHGGGRGNTAQALARWRHLVALHEATGVLHRAKHPALHCRICMAINFASNLPAFLLSVISLLATTIANDHVMVHVN